MNDDTAEKVFSLSLKNISLNFWKLALHFLQLSLTLKESRYQTQIDAQIII